MYVVVDGEPTWDVKKGPEVIRKQMETMEKAEAEEKTKPAVDENILKQINKAREFYNHLLKEMEAEGNTQ
jgi:hypothetical protein